jgi:hypothetical protein
VGGGGMVPSSSVRPQSRHPSRRKTRSAHASGNIGRCSAACARPGTSRRRHSRSRNENKPCRPFLPARMCTRPSFKSVAWARLCVADSPRMQGGTNCN